MNKVTHLENGKVKVEYAAGGSTLYPSIDEYERSVNTAAASHKAYSRSGLVELHGSLVVAMIERSSYLED